jgi:phage shock protein PspC (stress-responsive transcriptional regulator)
MKEAINSQRFYRDKQNAKVSGVCAGLAKYFDINPWFVRGASMISLLIFPVAVALAYVLAILLLSER